MSATVVFLRPWNFLGWSATPELAVNGELIGKIWNSNQIVVTVPAGALTLRTIGGEGGSMGGPTELEYPESQGIKAGETWYFHTFVVPGWLMPNYHNSRLEDKAKIDKMLKKCGKVRAVTVDHPPYWLKSNNANKK